MLMTSPDVDNCGASHFIMSPVPEDHWTLTHKEHPRWSPQSLVDWLKQQLFVLSDSEIIPGGPGGLRLITLSFLRVAIIAARGGKASKRGMRQKSLTWRHIEPYLRYGVQILLRSAARSYDALERENRSSLPGIRMLTDTPMGSPFQFPWPNSLPDPDQIEGPMYI